MDLKTLFEKGRNEKCLAAAVVHEYTSLEHAAAQDASEQKLRVVVIARSVSDPANPHSGGAKTVSVHKGKLHEHSIQIGRTWPFSSFTSLDVLTPDSPLLVPGFSKVYFWVFGSSRDRHDFERVLRKIYYSLTGLAVPTALTPPPVPQVSRRRTVSRGMSPRANTPQQHPQNHAIAQPPRSNTPQMQPQMQQQAHTRAMPPQPPHQHVSAPLNGPFMYPHQPVQKNVQPGLNVQQKSITAQQNGLNAQPHTLNAHPNAISNPTAASQPPFVQYANNATTPHAAPARPRTRPVLPPLNVNFDAPSAPGTLMSPIHSPRKPDDTATPSIAPLRPGAQFAPPHSAFPQLASPLDGEIAVPQRSKSRAHRLSLPPTKQRSPGTQSPIDSPIKSPVQRTKRELYNPTKIQPKLAPTAPTAPPAHLQQPQPLSHMSQPAQPLQVSANAATPAQTRMGALNRAISECRWDGGSVDELHTLISQKLGELADQNFSGVLSVDSQSKPLEQLVSQSLTETHLIDQKMKLVAMNLAGLNSDIKHIENQGDGLQVLTVSYRSLASEIEKILACSQIDETFAAEFDSLVFPEPQSPNWLQNLARCEQELKRLYKCLRLLAKLDDGAVLALKQPKQTAENAAQAVAAKFAAFFTATLSALLSSQSSLEESLLANMYVYCGCILFVHETCPSVYTQLVSGYEKQLSAYYSTKWTSRTRAALLTVEKLAAARPGSVELKAEELVPESSEEHEPRALKSVKLPPANAVKLYTLFDELVAALTTQTENQQQVLAQVFRIGLDESLTFLELVKRAPLPNRPIPSLSAARVPAQILNSVFRSSDTAILEFVDSINKFVPLELVYLMAKLDIANLEAKECVAERVNAISPLASKLFDEYIRNETKTVLQARYVTKKRVGVHPVVSRFTEQVYITESAYSKAVDSVQPPSPLPSPLPSRELLDKCHCSVFRAIAQGLRMGADSAELAGSVSTAAKLKAAAKEAGSSSGEEAKYLLNRHVVMIENLFKICTDLEQYSSKGIKAILKDARMHYSRELQSYTSDVLSRPLNKIYQFLNANEQRSTLPTKQKDVLQQLKRTAQIFEAKDVRKNIDVLKKRVEKHFLEAADKNVFVNVWREIREQYETVYDRVYTIAERVDGTSYLLVSRADISSSFD